MCDNYLEVDSIGLFLYSGCSLTDATFMSYYLVDNFHCPR